MPTVRGRILLQFIPSSSAELKEDRENSEVDLQGKQPPDKKQQCFTFQLVSFNQGTQLKALLAGFSRVTF